MTNNHKGYSRVSLAEAFEMEKNARKMKLSNGWEFDLMPWRGHELITISDKVVEIFMELSRNRDDAETSLDQLSFAQKAFKNHSGIVFEIILETLRAPGVSVVNRARKELIDLSTATVDDMRLRVPPRDLIAVLKAVWEVSIRPLLEELGLVPAEEEAKAEPARPSKPGRISGGRRRSSRSS